MVGITDAKSHQLIYLNRSAREVFGLVDVDIGTDRTASTSTARARRELYREHDPARRCCGARPGAASSPCVTGDGAEIEVWQTITPTLLRRRHRSHQISIVGRDVTERRRFEADLAYQATHDSLTGLPNRALLLDHLELALARAERDNRLIALLFLDLDRFKQVNDTHGHDAGDELLAQTARLHLRGRAPVGHGGPTRRRRVRDPVRRRRRRGPRRRRRPPGGRRHRVAPVLRRRHETWPISASIGIALSAGGAGHPEALLRDADAAMYRAKDLGRARLEIYDETMRRRTAHRLELSEQLADGHRGRRHRRALPARRRPRDRPGHLRRGPRPLGPPRPRRAAGPERVHRPGRGDRPHRRARPAGAQHRVRARPAVGGALRRRRPTGARQPVGPPAHHVEPARCSCRACSRAPGLTPSQLCLEITESVLMEDASAVIDTLWELKAIGVMLAIDDFGTGYSSLSYLRRFPVDVLKVDQSFVAGLGPDPEDSTIVAAIVNLADTLELEAIAEGVETRRAGRAAAGPRLPPGPGLLLRRAGRARRDRRHDRARLPALSRRPGRASGRRVRGRRPRWRTAWRSGPRRPPGRRGCRARSGDRRTRRPTRSARSAVESRWAITTTVRPSMSRSMARSTSSSVPGSRLEVASSSTSSAGSTSAARASDTSCFSPADSREPRSRTSVSSPWGSDREALEHADGGAAPRRSRRRWRHPGRCGCCRGSCR